MKVFQGIPLHHVLALGNVLESCTLHIREKFLTLFRSQFPLLGVNKCRVVERKNLFPFCFHFAGSLHELKYSFRLGNISFVFLKSFAALHRELNQSFLFHFSEFGHPFLQVSAMLRYHVPLLLQDLVTPGALFPIHFYVVLFVSQVPLELVNLSLHSLVVLCKFPIPFLQFLEFLVIVFRLRHVGVVSIIELLFQVIDLVLEIYSKFINLLVTLVLDFLPHEFVRCSLVFDILCVLAFDSGDDGFQLLFHALVASLHVNPLLVELILEYLEVSFEFRLKLAYLRFVHHIQNSKFLRVTPLQYEELVLHFCQAPQHGLNHRVFTIHLALVLLCDDGHLVLKISELLFAHLGAHESRHESLVHSSVRLFP
mmetsp:Transcript_16351/g.33172  ORF Transcript_16351/g.33172 Transcript_16351/m.33172 type:complete len:368 (-) Transcript_16351:211-1314(-)